MHGVTAGNGCARQYKTERNDLMSSRSSRKRRIRYDRLISTLVIPVVFLIILIAVITSSCGSDKESKETSENPAVSDESSRVNKNGNPEYEIKYLKRSDIYKGSLILVNDSHEYLASPEDESLTGIDEIKNDYYSIRNIGMKMDTLALKNFNSMMSGFYQQYSDRSIMITEGYVSANHQNMLYNQALENSLYESKGGFSEHQTGLAVDLGIYPDSGESYRYVPDEKYSWIKENCTKYGFIQRYPEGKSDKTGVSDHTEHFRYVGIPHADYITENNLTLEEYLQMMKKYAYTNKTLSISCNSKDYEVYYIKADDENSDSVEVYVPQSNPYTISGNNADGFIITVEK